jgi:Flp pilus assembly protein TadD
MSFACIWRSIDRVSVTRGLTLGRLILFGCLAGCLGTTDLSAMQLAEAEACSGPPALEAERLAHPSEDVYVALGAWFSENRKLDCAVEALRSGLKLEPGSERLHLLLGATLVSFGRDREALPEWEAALRIDPSSKAALDGLARSLIATGDYAAVIARLGSIPRDEALTLDLASAYRKSEMFDQSAQVLAEALKSNPQSDGLTSALVSLEVHQSQYAAAEKLAEEIARAKPGDIEAQRIYLRTLVLNGDNDAATTLGRKLLALAPQDADLLNLNGLLERKAGEYAEARTHLEQAVRLNPNDFNSRVNLGLVLVQLNDPAGATEQLEKAVELGATEPQVRFELAKTLRTLGKSEESQQQLKLYQQALKDEADQSLAVLKATEAAQAQKDGDNQKAAGLYREACAAEPKDAGLAYRLSQVLGTLNDGAGQRSALEQAIQANPDFVLAHYDLGYLEFRGGENPAAEEQFRLVVKLAPGHAQAWISLAATLATESRIAEARDAVGTALKLEPNNAGAISLRDKLARDPR